MQQHNAKSMKCHKMQQSNFHLPDTATDATSGSIYIMDKLWQDV